MSDRQYAEELLIRHNKVYDTIDRIKNSRWRKVKMWFSDKFNRLIFRKTTERRGNFVDR
jgi:hypothetical protein